jgi:membrane protein DedA with SNARE-associated domain
MDHLVAHYGYATIALLVAAEGVGIPLPGETALITGAALAARGHLSLVWVIIAAAAGVSAGGCGGYWIGKTGGRAIVVRYGKWIGIKAQELDYAQRFFQRHGALAVLVGRFLPVIRILTGLAAGITQMPFGRFVVVNMIAGVLWSSLFGVLGYESSRNMFRLEHQYGRMVVVGLVVLAAIGFAIFKWWERRATQRAVPSTS